MKRTPQGSAFRSSLFSAVGALGAVIVAGFVVLALGQAAPSRPSRGTIAEPEPHSGRPGFPANADPQISPFNQNDPCAMFRQPGFPKLCAPVKIFVTDSVEEKTGDRYCDPPGVLPCNEIKYIKRYVTFEYEAEASGFMLYNKDLSEFTVAIQGTPQKTRIVRIKGYNRWFTQKGGSGARVWQTRDFPVGPVTIRIPIRLSITYPHGEESKWNLSFSPLDIGSNDDELPTTSGSHLGSEAAGQGPKPWTITPQEMKQIMAAGGFDKSFQWRIAQPDGNSYEDHSLTIKCEMGEPCAEKIQLAIRTQDGQDKYCFSEATPGKLEFTLVADVTPSALADDVTWTLPELQGSTRLTSPSDAKGRTIKVTYTNLPKGNSDFGLKTITAAIKHNRCEARAQKGLRFFFPAFAKNNPGGADPNWFYYWKQTSACVGPAKFGGGTGQCSINPSSRDLGYYRNIIFDTAYYICDLKNLGPDFPFVAKQIAGGKWADLRVTGIDTFAVACLHENAHYTHFTQWWKQYRTSDKFEDGNQNGILDDKEELLDKDKDLVPDALEVGLHLDPKNRNTYGIGPDGDDEEALCWFAEAGWKVGKADKEDWAKPGRQWK
jgi:hypothetical protein